MKQKRINYVTDGLSGSIGKLVFSERNGFTIVGRRPIRTAPFSAAQEAIKANFKLAVKYAKAILQDAGIKAAYKAKAKGLQSAYNLALADFFNAPVIHEVDVSRLTNIPGSPIIAIVSDDFEVKAVMVRIEKSDGSLIEEGNAFLQDDGLHWTYNLTTANANNAGNKVVVTATDLPGHSITEIKTL